MGSFSVDSESVFEGGGLFGDFGGFAGPSCFGRCTGIAVVASASLVGNSRILRVESADGVVAGGEVAGGAGGVVPRSSPSHDSISRSSRGGGGGVARCVRWVIACALLMTAFAAFFAATDSLVVVGSLDALG